MKDINESSVAVVIVNYNAGSLLVDCIKSIIEGASEVIVVDNASSDVSLSTCKSLYCDEEKLSFLCNQENLGFAAACNQGVLLTDCHNILFLNPDCLLKPSALNELLSVLRAREDVGMVGGLLKNPDGSEQAGGRRTFPSVKHSFVRAFGLSRFSAYWPELFFDFHLNNEPLPSEPIEVDAISGACMLVKREVFSDVGRWDEGYFLHCEDLDLCMRFWQKGWKIIFVPTAPVTHILGACGEGKKLFVEWHKHKGMLRFYNKFFKEKYPKPLAWFVALGVGLRFLLIVSYFSLQGVFRKS